MKGRRDAGGSQGERLGVLSFAISLRRGKEMASKPNSARAKQCAPGYEDVENLAPPNKKGEFLSKFSFFIFHQKLILFAI